MTIRFIEEEEDYTSEVPYITRPTMYGSASPHEVMLRLFSSLRSFNPVVNEEGNVACILKQKDQNEGVSVPLNSRQLRNVLRFQYYEQYNIPAEPWLIEEVMAIVEGEILLANIGKLQARQLDGFKNQ